jgi:hypothetical protein
MTNNESIQDDGGREVEQPPSADFSKNLVARKAARAAAAKITTRGKSRVADVARATASREN